MKERILIVEDTFINGLFALIAFDEDEGVEDAIVVGELEEALKQAEEFRPTVALLDINIIGGKGTEVGKILAEKKIPFVYVTGITKDGREPDSGHDKIDSIEIKNSIFETLENFPKVEKLSEIWLKAYEYATLHK